MSLPKNVADILDATTDATDIEIAKVMAIRMRTRPESAEIVKDLVAHMSDADIKDCLLYTAGTLKGAPHPGVTLFNDVLTVDFKKLGF